MSIQIGNRWGSHLAQLTKEWFQRPRGAADRAGDYGYRIPDEVTVTFRNDTGETVPAGGIMAITGVEEFGDGSLYLTIAKPSSDFCLSYAVNADDDIDTADAADLGSGYGQCYTFGRCRVLYESAATPAVDEVYGPEPDQWYATAGPAPSGWEVGVLGIADADATLLLGDILMESGLLRWGRVQSGFTNAKADSQKTVSVIACDSDDTDGSTETGDAFNVLTPIRKNRATALFTGYVVGYVQDVAGDKIIVTDCFDDPLGTVKQWDDAIGDVPDGWSELTGAQGRYIVGVDGSHDLDLTGGALTHTHVHSVTPGAHDPGVSNTCVNAIDDHTANHEPPWLGLYNIKRTS